MSILNFSMTEYMNDTLKFFPSIIKIFFESREIASRKFLIDTKKGSKDFEI